MLIIIIIITTFYVRFVPSFCTYLPYTYVHIHIERGTLLRCVLLPKSFQINCSQFKLNLLLTITYIYHTRIPPTRSGSSSSSSRWFKVKFVHPLNLLVRKRRLNEVERVVKKGDDFRIFK